MATPVADPGISYLPEKFRNNLVYEARAHEGGKVYMENIDTVRALNDAGGAGEKVLMPMRGVDGGDLTLSMGGEL